MKNVQKKSRRNWYIKTNEFVFFTFIYLSLSLVSFKQPQSTSNDGASSSQHHSSTTTTSSRPTDLADSVVPQGATRDLKIEPRQNQPPLPPSRPVQPPLPPQSTGAIQREQPAAPSFSSSNRPPVPSHNSSSRPQSFQHSSSSHYQAHSHVNNNYNQHSRYPPRPGLPPPNRSSQQQPPLPPPQHSNIEFF